MKRKFSGPIILFFAALACSAVLVLPILGQIPVLRHRAALARWQRLEPNHYRFRADYTRINVQDGTREHWTYAIEIEDQVTIALIEMPSRQAAQLGHQGSYLPLDQMLTRIDERLNGQWRVLQLDIRNEMAFSPIVPYAQALAQEIPTLDDWVPGSRRIEFIDPDCERFSLHAIEYDIAYGYPTSADFTFNYISFESVTDYSATRRCRNAVRIQIEISEFEVLR